MMFKKSKLHNAIMDGNILRMKELLDLGTNPNYADDYGRTFLWFAINRGNLAAVMVLVDNCATVSTETRFRGSLLQTAAEKGSVEIAAYLLSKNPELLQLKDRDGNNALHTAATAGYPDMLAFLIEKGLDPNDKNFNNSTPLALAQKGSHAEAIEVLKPYAPARSRALPALESEAAPAADTDGEWKKLPGERIARVAVEDAIGYRITEIFNFAAREKTTLYRNLESNAETVETRGFDAMGDKTPIEQALAELQKRGGLSDVTSISGFEKKKLAP